MRTGLPKNLLEARGSSAIPMTPFDENDRIDVGVLEREIEFIVQCGATSICTPVWVSEFDLLSEEDRKMMIRVPIEVNRGRCAVIANVAAVNAPLAARYAEYAEKMGADCVIAMGPYVRATDFELVTQYYKAISDAVTIPVMIQNAGNCAQLTPQQIVRLCEEIENVRYVKQEVMPQPMTISGLFALNSTALKMVMSGEAGLFSPMDFARGAIATIHACEYCDVIQKIWDLLYAGREQEALDLHCAILPALQMESLLGIPYMKEVMVRRGVFTNARTRSKAGGLSADDLRDLDRIWARIEPHFAWRGF